MRARSEVLITLAVALLVLSFHLRLKKEPDYRAISQIAEMSAQAQDWLGQVPPELDLQTIDGQQFNLADHVGREVVILNFFATWCAPCRAEMPELQRFYAAHSRQPVTLVGVDAYERPELVKKFRSDMKLTFPIVIAGEDMVKRFGVTSFPTTVVIGPDGTIHLYELSAIANADVTLEPFVTVGLRMIATGAGITKEQFIARSAAESRRAVPRSAEDRGPKLTGRALQIAQTTDCVCGCKDKLTVCKCNTASKMKEKLAKGDFGSKTDAEIKTDLNAEFCMKSGM
jgi:thiol-disulfide isomerase/thioredoxin